MAAGCSEMSAHWRTSRTIPIDDQQSSGPPGGYAKHKPHELDRAVLGYLALFGFSIVLILGGFIAALEILFF
jgi:hypothetical protein